MNTEAIQYNVDEATIQKLKSDYMSLKVANVRDTASYELCKRARKEVRSHRLAVEERRKELKKDALEYGRRVDSAAKEITAQLTEIEEHLKAQEQIVDDEKERKRLEEFRRREALKKERAAKLQAVNAQFDYESLEEMSDNAFTEMLAEATAAHERLQAERKAEQERLAKLEAEAAEARAKQAKIDEENRKLREEIEAHKRAKLEAEQKAVAEEQERLAAEQRKVAAERAEAERQEQERIAKENARIAAEKAAKAKAEAQAAKKVRDKKLFDSIKKEFPTLEAAWVEIARLKRVAGEAQ